jgi:hypothetical protein
MQNSSTKSLPLSEASSFVAVTRGFLDEDDLEDVVRFHVMILVICSTGSIKASEIQHNGKKYEKQIKKVVYVIKITTGSTRQFVNSSSILDLKIELSHKNEKLLNIDSQNRS